MAAIADGPTYWGVTPVPESMEHLYEQFARQARFAGRV
jgi:hypothetical protein